jgi:UDP-N-acetylmuramate--alanine ligase
MAKEHVYFIGIGGIGMSALARYFKLQGYRVSGSDGTASQITKSLKKDSITVKIGHSKDNVPSNAAFVIYNRAIPVDNPELLAASKLQLPILPYAAVLGKLTEQYLTIAITGSHGKSTTTALAGLALTAGGLDPTVLVGTNLKEFGDKNIRCGRSPYLVLEADDFGAAFLDYSPFISIITNVDREHMDFYKTFARVKAAFLKFMARTREGGALILNRDDAVLYSMRAKITTIARAKNLRVIWYSTKHFSSGSAATASAVTAGAVSKIRSAMKIPGEHNVSNASAVYELARLLNINEKKIISALGSYHGSWRRMEYRGELKIARLVIISIYDDYAHHPTEIRATLDAFRKKYPHSPLVCVFQPHQAKRLKVLFREFVESFVDADILVLVPAYTVVGRDDVNSKFTSKRLATAIQKKYPGKNIFYLANPKDIKKTLEKIIVEKSELFSSKEPANLIMMGAGDVVKYTDLLI